MDVVIIGAGGVGLALGTCLHASGQAVRFVVRGDGPHAIERDGFRRSGLFGDVWVPPHAVRVSALVSALADTAPDAILVCTKTPATATIAEQLGDVWPSLGGEPPVVLCQNGWGSAERFAAHLPRDRIFNARVITGFTRQDPTHVRVTVHADAIHLGSLFGSAAEPIADLAAAIDRGGIPCEVTTDIEADLWAKLLYNCLLNPLGALVAVSYGELGKENGTRSIMERVATEIFDVMDAAGRRTHWPTAEAYLEVFYRDLLPPTASHESSMLQDLSAGRRTEVDALTGAVVRLAAHHGVDAPVCEALTELVRAAEDRAVSPEAVP